MFFLQCHREKQKYQFTYDDFKTKATWNGIAYRLTNINQPWEVCVIPEKNLLLVVDLKGSYFLCIYELNSLRFIKKAIKRGSGPNEQLDCHKIQYISGDFYSVDLIKKKIFKYSIEDVQSPNALCLPISDVQITFNPERPVVLRNGQIVDLRFNKLHQKTGVLNFYDKNGDSLFFKGKIPTTGKKYDDDQLTTAFRGGLNLSGDGNNLILSYFNTDYIDLYDTLGNLKKRVQGPDQIEPDVKTINFLDSRVTVSQKHARKAYKVPRMYKDNIYILYDGEESTPNSYHLNTLFNFDSNLIPKAYIKLSKPIFAFDIDWINGTLYGITNQDKNGTLIKYKLK